jgi:hypothetical protein
MASACKIKKLRCPCNRLWRPLRLGNFLENGSKDVGEVVSYTHLLRFALLPVPQDHSWCLFLLETAFRNTEWPHDHHDSVY